jgi:hypothetical protein
MPMGEEDKKAMAIEAMRIRRLEHEKTRLRDPEASFLLKLQLNETFRKIVDVILSIFVRVVYIIEATFFIYFTATLQQSGFVYFLMFFTFIIIIDGIFIVFKRLGKEYTW